MVSSSWNSSNRVRPGTISTDDSPNLIKGVGALLDVFYRCSCHQQFQDFHKFVIADQKVEQIQYPKVENWRYGNNQNVIDSREDEDEDHSVQLLSNDVNLQDGEGLNTVRSPPPNHNKTYDKKSSIGALLFKMIRKRTSAYQVRRESSSIHY